MSSGSGETPPPNPSHDPTTSGSTGQGTPSAFISAEQVVPGYTLVEHLGEQGFGTLYKATELATGQTVAIKLFRATRDATRFWQEQETLRRLNDPDRTSVRHSGIASTGQSFVVTDYAGSLTRDGVDEPIGGAAEAPAQGLLGGSGEHLTAPSLEEVRSLYDQLPIRASLLGWEVLTDEQRIWVRTQVVATTISVTKSAGDGALTLDAQTIEAIRRIPTLLEQLLAVLSAPPGGPPPTDSRGRPGGDDDEEFSQIWTQLSAEQRAILKFIKLKGDNVITYTLIAANVTVPRLPGDTKDELMSDRTVAKHCRQMEQPPLALITRSGERSGIQLSAKGDRLVRRHSRKDFS